jgi:GntR family transcriptional regulator
MVRKNVPLAQQVVTDILAELDGGNLARNDGLLPSEAELSRRFSVSRATVRDALSRLEQRGLVIRRHGVGTFVTASPPVLHGGLEQLESLHTMARRIGLEIQMGELKLLEREATAYEADRLQIAVGTPVLFVTRVILTGGHPIAYLIDVVPTEFLQTKDLDESFDGSVLDVFLQRAKPVLGYSLTEISNEAIDAAIARLLHLQRGEMLLKLEAQLFAREDRVVDYSVSYFVPGYFRFRVLRRINPCEN